MWKIIAADDEGYIREALQKLIDWEKMDCSLEAVACDGQELLGLMEELRADIVITDIRMPGLDGLEVCRFLYETYPRTQVILLTAHSEFEYARAAIRYNVCEYVLKVSIIEELPKAVGKAVGELEKARWELEKKNGRIQGICTSRWSSILSRTTARGSHWMRSPRRFTPTEAI